MSCDSKAECWEEPHLCCWPNCKSADARATERDVFETMKAERDAALNAIRSTIVVLDGHGVCQTMADALRVLISRVDATGSILGEWPPASTLLTSASHQPPKPQST